MQTCHLIQLVALQFSLGLFPSLCCIRYRHSVSASWVDIVMSVASLGFIYKDQQILHGGHRLHQRWMDCVNNYRGIADLWLYNLCKLYPAASRPILIKEKLYFRFKSSSTTLLQGVWEWERERLVEQLFSAFFHFTACWQGAKPVRAHHQ